MKWPLFEKVIGCGCLMFLGALCFAFVGGALMGDYMGPASGRNRDQAEKRVRIIGGLIGVAACFGAGVRLLGKDRKG
jgi:hypothetical protein